MSPNHQNDKHIEKLPHVDETRMRDIPDADLFAALDLALPALETVRAAAQSADWDTALTAWSQYFARRPKPLPLQNRTHLRRLNQASPFIQSKISAILQSAEALITAEIDFTDLSRGGVSGIYGFHYLHWMTSLIDAYALTGNPRFVQTFDRLFNQWYAKRSLVQGAIPHLDVIWYTLGLAIRTPILINACHTFRHSDFLSPQAHARLLKTVLGACRWLAEEHDQFRYGNWQIHGAAGLFEIAVFFPEFHEAASWRLLSLARLMEHLELDVYPDGGHSERAQGYHGSVLGAYSRVACAARLVGDNRLHDRPRFHQMFRWLIDQCTPLGCTVNFNDSRPVWVGPFAVQGAVLCRDPEMKSLALQLGTPDEIAWTLASLPDEPDGQTAADIFASLSSKKPVFKSRLFEDSKFALLRSGLDPGDLFLQVNYGPVVGHEHESHSHMDTLSFVAIGHGFPLAVEAGLPIKTYDDPLYHGWAQRAVAHNMLLVDQQEPSESGKDADLLAWSTTSVADLFLAQHAGYASLGVQHCRSILFVHDDYWIITDQLLQTGSHRLDWQVYLPSAFHLTDDALIPDETPGLVVYPVVRPAGAWRTEIIQGVANRLGPRSYDGSLYPQEQSEVLPTEIEVKGVRYSVETDQSPARFITILFPVSAGRRPQSVEAQPIASDGTSFVACRVIAPGMDDLFILKDSQSAQASSVSGWRSDAAFWLIRSAYHWAFWNGSFLEYAGKVLLRASAPLVSAAAWSEAGSLDYELVASRRTSVRVLPGFKARQIQLNSISLPISDAEEIELLLPCAGRFSIHVFPQ